MDWKDIGIRAGKTFLQAFLAVILTANLTSVADLADLALLDQAAVAGLAALISFAQNVLTELASRPSE